MALKIHPSAGPLPPCPILSSDAAVWEANKGNPDAVQAWGTYLRTGDVGGLVVPSGTATATVAALSPSELAYAYRAVSIACTPGATEARAYVDHFHAAKADCREAHRIALKLAGDEDREVSQEEEDRIMRNLPEPPTAQQLALASEWSDEIAYAFCVSGVVGLSAFPGIKPNQVGRWRLYPRDVLDRLPQDVVYELAGRIQRASTVTSEGKA